jgi:homoserine O-acetyltransferase/O-succinyltransferase
MLVEKRTFEMPELRTVAGKTIRHVKVGWESYGALNADRSNAILVAHYFSGTSHAAGITCCISLRPTRRLCPDRRRARK